MPLLGKLQKRPLFKFAVFIQNPPSPNLLIQSGKRFAAGKSCFLTGVCPGA
jgi:hypothetical protein